MDCEGLDAQYMRRALELAQQGMGAVAPNPMVGAVLVREGQLLAEGYHARYGTAHAERAAIEQARRMGIDLEGATLYVNLEPCNHQGKTPPCTEAIAQTGISRVVVATLDPNPQVAGQGVEALRAMGKTVEVGLMAHEAQELNRRFFTHHTQRRPYIVLKWAQSADGFIDSDRSADEPPVWITNNAARVLVHRWRAEEMAILVGTSTVVRDNPQLTVRHWCGNNPLRVVLDRTLRIPAESHVFDGSTPTLVFAGKNLRSSQRSDTLSQIPNLDLELVDFMKGITGVLLDALYTRGVTSLMIEGGTLLISNFMAHGLWDEARVFVGNSFIRRGVAAPCIPEEPCEAQQVGDVRLYHFRRRSAAETPAQLVGLA